MRILITGGSGYLGNALTEFLINNDYTVCIYSRDEYKQALMRDKFGTDKVRYLIGDVRDKDRLYRALLGTDAVIHAAALKRIEVGHYNTDEVVKTNIIGSMNVVEAAHEAGVEKALLVSTDKAWQPISPYGQSKALAESLFLNANNMYGLQGPKYSVVRYGNVWNSTGSIYQKWKALIAQNKPVPVTDPECTRFFMTIEEAVALVCSALAEMKGGELIVPENLPAYRVGALALAMSAQMDVGILPPWEKRHEGMKDGLTSDKAPRLTVDDLRKICYITGISR